jgi:hypothetical protein
VRLLEVIGVALARVEVALSNIRHAYMLPRPSGLFGAARDRLKDGKSRSGSRSRRLAGGSKTTLARSTPRALYFLKVYELGRGPLGGSPRATAPTSGRARVRSTGRYWGREGAGISGDTPAASAVFEARQIQTHA